MESDARPRLPCRAPLSPPPESPTVAKGVRPLLARLGGVAMDREARARRLGARGVTVTLSSSIFLDLGKGAMKQQGRVFAGGENKV